jgi:hypothetical protein
MSCDREVQGMPCCFQPFFLLLLFLVIIVKFQRLRYFEAARDMFPRTIEECQQYVKAVESRGKNEQRLHFHDSSSL